MGTVALYVLVSSVIQNCYLRSSQCSAELGKCEVEQASGLAMLGISVTQPCCSVWQCHSHVLMGPGRQTHTQESLWSPKASKAPGLYELCQLGHRVLNAPQQGGPLMQLDSVG
ncbi:GATA zinc finger domain-containing protein 1 [Platysternon megacephalum]|uniref:GATA zinc finger domain-containing protein 1 n=1 Tax=Platysternon megacephalum TaxID=55544 RepID=A0A4D9EK71_9SAUR|nr:GATA zinc finger domain-containing protein 1 [Platysternon megacephalum]